ncbi:hypothetical protein ANAEL_01864 [Anaerolineales bacterium]|nr:hypothetical protein ANAEL_01864 [Anaerolineales bacterium]
MNTQSVFLSKLQSTYNRWLFTASLLSSVAGIIHAYYMPEHFEMWVGYGAFFLVVTACQVMLSLVLLAFRPVPRIVLWAGILGNAAITIMWLISRTSGLPYGPMIGEVEEIGVLDLSSKIAEVGVMVCLIVLLRAKQNFGTSANLPSA